MTTTALRDEVGRQMSELIPKCGIAFSNGFVPRNRLFVSETSSPNPAQAAFDRKVSRLAAAFEPVSATITAAEVREGLPYETLESISRTLGLTQETLTRVLHTSDRTLQRRRRDERLSPVESDRLWRIAHVYRLAVEAFDSNLAEAHRWLTTPNHTLGGDTPIEHLDTEPGERIVEQMLAVIEHTMPA